MFKTQLMKSKETVEPTYLYLYVDCCPESNKKLI